MKSWTVVIPVKGTTTAKSRLAASPELALAIAVDTVSAALAARALTDVIVVTSAEAAADFARLGARAIADPAEGLVAAISAGLVAAGEGPVAVLLGDLPGLRHEELEVALDLAARHPLAMVADADNQGTVLITALDAAAHRPAFGANSRAAHLALGYIELDIPSDSGLRRDVDTREQLVELGSRLGPRTTAGLRDEGRQA